MKLVLVARAPQLLATDQLTVLILRALLDKVEIPVRALDDIVLPATRPGTTLFLHESIDVTDGDVP